MALRLKAKGKWREVSSDALKGFSDLISIQELTDYEFVREIDSGAKRVKYAQSKDEKKKANEEEGEYDVETQKKRKLNKTRKMAEEAGDNIEPPKKRLKKGEDEEEDEEETEKNESPDSTTNEKDRKKKKKRNKKKKGEKERMNVEQEQEPHSRTDADSEVSDAAPERTSTDGKKKKKRNKKKKGEKRTNGEQEQEPHSRADDDSEVSDAAPERTSTDGKKKKKRNKKKGKKTNDCKKTEEQKRKEEQSVSHHNAVTDMSKWSGLFVPDIVLKNLAELGFSAPTLVQERCLPVAIKGNVDIIAAAETGSGKTLAFGIPLIDRILNCRKVAEEEKAEEDSHTEEKENEEEEEVGEDEEVCEDSAENEEDMETSNADDEDASEQDDDGEEGDDDEEEASEVEDEADKDEDEDGVDDNEEVDKDEDEDGMDDNKGVDKDDRPLYALVLTPTRELAFQIRDHLRSISKDANIECQVLVGGMSIQRQSRLLDRCPEIVVATPGRLWDIFKQGNKHLNKLKYIRCLVIDEADRMVEKFHFEQLSSILAEINHKDGSKDYRQTFILSATLTYVPPKPQRAKFAKKGFKEMSPKEKLESLCSQIGIRGKPKIVDLTPQQRTASKLTETRLNFSAVEEKDLHLYCFLKEYPGRTIVFANSIDCVWRLMRLLVLLKMTPLRLFADMQQKQRLKSLETFKANPHSLLLATDVAARGLDIAGVDHVIHYEVPRTTESYIHRSGRTARANSEGFSVLFVGPKEAGNYRKLMKALDRDDLPVFPTNDGMLWSAKERVTLARKVELDEFNSQKTKRKKLEEIAVDAGLEDEATQSYDEDEEFRKAEERRALGWERKQLQFLLSQPLIAKSTHTKYPTKSGQMVWPYLEGETRGRAIEMSQKKPKLATKRSKKFTRKRNRK